MAAPNFVAHSAQPGYVLLNYLKDFRHFPDGSNSYCNSCHKIMLCLYWSVVHPEKEIQWSQVRGARGPGYWASTSNPSVDQRFIQMLMDNMSDVCRGAIMLEPHFMTDFQRHHLQQLG
jgi:hypothetical protein